MKFMRPTTIPFIGLLLLAGPNAEATEDGFVAGSEKDLYGRLYAKGSILLSPNPNVTSEFLGYDAKGNGHIRVSLGTPNTPGYEKSYRPDIVFDPNNLSPIQLLEVSPWSTASTFYKRTKDLIDFGLHVYDKDYKGAGEIVVKRSVKELLSQPVKNAVKTLGEPNNVEAMGTKSLEKLTKDTAAAGAAVVYDKSVDQLASLRKQIEPSATRNASDITTPDGPGEANKANPVQPSGVSRSEGAKPANGSREAGQPTQTSLAPTSDSSSTQTGNPPPAQTGNLPPSTAAAAGTAKAGISGEPPSTTAPGAGQGVNQQQASTTNQQTASTTSQQVASTTQMTSTAGQPGDAGTASSAPTGNAGAGTAQYASSTTAPPLADQTPAAQELQRQQLNQQYPDDPAFQKPIGSRDAFSPQDIEARQKWHEAQDKASSDYQDKSKLGPMDPNLNGLRPSDDIKNLVDPPVNAADKVQLGDVKDKTGSGNLSNQAFALAKEGQNLADAMNSGQKDGALVGRLYDLRDRVEAFKAQIPPGGSGASTDPNVTALLDAAKKMMALGQAAMRDPGSAKANLAEANRLLNQARQSAAGINGNQSRSSPSTITGGNNQQPEQVSLGTDNVTGGGVGFQIQKPDLKPSAKTNSSSASTMRGFVDASSNARPAATGAKPALTLTVANGSGATGDFKSVWPSSSGGGINKFTSSSSSSATGSGSRAETYKVDSGVIGTGSTALVKPNALQVSNGTGASIAPGASVATTSPRITTTLQPSVNIRAAGTAASSAAAGAASNAAGKTASTAASTAASGAASNAASKSAAGAASRAASTVASTSASNAAGHAASNAAASAAGRAASSAASNAASKAASNAASNAASRAASSAASNAASRAASNAASNAASRIRIPSDLRLKQDIVELATLANGLRLYRYRYIGDRTFYVGVMAQEVAQIDPAAVGQDANGFLSVDYARLGIDFLTFEAWTARPGAPITH